MPPNASYTCTFTEFISGDFGGPNHVNTATVIASDGDGNTDTDSDDATVTYTDVLPDISVIKTANPTRASVPETGGNVTFTSGDQQLGRGGHHHRPVRRQVRHPRG